MTTFNSNPINFVGAPPVSVSSNPIVFAGIAPAGVSSNPIYFTAPRVWFVRATAEGLVPVQMAQASDGGVDTLTAAT